MKNSLILFLIFSGLFAHSQTKSVLFLGNSYTAVNNLPALTADLAISVGDTLIYDSNTPGGYTLQAHSTNTTSLDKIRIKQWDFVVLQEQSQRPAMRIEQVTRNVFPYAQLLDSINLASNPCGETMFYMTWGRKNGDASNCENWPPVCTYSGMDSLLHLRYMMMANSNLAVTSPVGAVWHYIRDHFPEIELYSQDESHPSAAGSYAAACSFYTAIFHKDPTLILNNSSLTPENAATIRQATKTVVYDSLLKWNIGKYDLTSTFTFEQISGYTYQFYNQSENHTKQIWNFGADLDTTANPIYTFSESGNYDVELTTLNECDSLTSTQQVIVLPTYMDEYKLINAKLFHPNPATDMIFFDINQNSIESVSIYKLSGMRVLFLKNPTQKQVSTKHLNEGVYLIKVVSQKNTHINKLIIKR